MTVHEAGEGNVSTAGVLKRGLKNVAFAGGLKISASAQVSKHLHLNNIVQSYRMHRTRCLDHLFLILSWTPCGLDWRPW